MADVQDALSPTTLVINYLKGKGLAPNAGNIRAALTENARDPTLIPGLRNSAPGEDTNGASPKASGPGPGVGQRGSAASKIEGSKTTSAAPSPQDHPNSSMHIAQPSASGSSGGLDWDTILGLGATSAAALAGRQGGNAAEFVGNSGPPPFAPGAAPDALPAPIGAPAQAPPPVIANDPMQAALEKATAPPAMPQLGAAGGNGAVVPSTAIPMPDATSGPVITPQNVGSGPPMTTPRTQAPMPEPAQTPGLWEDFARFVRGFGARR